MISCLLNRSRALAALLLCLALMALACDEASTASKVEETTPAPRAASDSEINRAAGGGDEAATQPDRADLAPQEAAKKVAEATFVHRSTDKNSRGDYTYLSAQSIDGNPNAAVFAEPVADAGSDYEHNIGVWYEPRAQKWAIFNQDLAAVPAGSAFEVVVPPKKERFVHHSSKGNTKDEGAFLDHPLVNGKPEARVSVTQNWNPGGGTGTYNNHPVGVRYYPDRGRWEVFNEDGSAMPRAAAFNVTVSEAAPTASDGVVDVDTGEAPGYRDFFSEGNPQTPAALVSSDSSSGAIPVVRPFNFGRDPRGPEDRKLALTIPELDLDDVPVFDTLSEGKLRDGTVHIPATGYPWQKGANVYIAGHRVGYEGTESAYVFFHLDWLGKGDEILLEDATGTEYRYRVTKRKVVGPKNVEVMNAVEGKSLITLQTCTLPDYDERLIVQGELVEKRS